MEKKTHIYIISIAAVMLCSACGMRRKLHPETLDQYPQKYPNELQQKCK
jgi:hypothetical protein